MWPSSFASCDWHCCNELCDASDRPRHYAALGRDLAGGEAGWDAGQPMRSWNLYKPWLVEIASQLGTMLHISSGGR